MNNDQLKRRLKRAVDQAPVDLLESIKQQPYEKMSAHDEITSQTDGKLFKQRSNHLKPVLALLSAAAVFLFAFVNWQMNTRWVDSMVYLDVNPSLQIETNRKDQVIRISGLDEESEALIKDLDYRGKDLEAVAAELLDRLVLGDYVSSSEPAILLSVYNEDPEKRDRQLSELDQAIHAYLQNLKIQPIVLTQPLDPTQTLTDYAAVNQISVSKMTLIRNMIILDPELKVEDLAKLTLEQLIQVSSKVTLDLDKIIQSSDLDRIKTLDDHDDDEDDKDDEDDEDYEDNEDDGDEFDDESNDDKDDSDDSEDSDEQDDSEDLNVNSADDSEDEDATEDGDKLDVDDDPEDLDDIEDVDVEDLDDHDDLDDSDVSDDSDDGEEETELDD